MPRLTEIRGKGDGRDEIHHHHSVENENRVFYHIFPELKTNESDRQDVKQGLVQLIDDTNKYLSGYLKDYLWHEESFVLRSSVGDTPSSGSFKYEYFNLPHVYGSTGFGECIDDEWFIVYLLYALSRKYPKCVFSVYDNDGEFLLMEAAFDIPNWLTPAKSNNRVFISNGKLHIIPLAKARRPGIKDAHSLVRNERIDTCASSNVQRSIERRLNEYPMKIKESKHTIRVLVPASLAVLMRTDATLIAKCVSSFVSQDDYDRRRFAKLDRFCGREKKEKQSAAAAAAGDVEHHSSQSNTFVVPFVFARVSMTRWMFGQFITQPFVVPRWYPTSVGDEVNVSASERGARILMGFELLYADHCTRDKRALASMDSVSPTSAEFMSFLHRREFDGDIDGERYEGSKLGFIRWKREEKYGISLAEKIDSILGGGTSAADMRDQIEHWGDVEDDTNLSLSDESWMNVSPEELDRIMNERFGENVVGGRNELSLDDDDDNDDADGDDDRNRTNEMVKQTKSFLDEVSPFDGIISRLDNKKNNSQSKKSSSSSSPPPTAANSTVEGLGLGFDPDLDSLSKQFEKFFSMENSEALEKFLFTDDDDDEDGTNAIDSSRDVKSKVPLSFRTFGLNQDGEYDNEDFDNDNDDNEDEDDDLSSDDDGEFGDGGEPSGDYLKYIEEMEAELKGSNVLGEESFLAEMGAADDNIAANFLRSLDAQQGMPGPVTSLLSSMGMKPPSGDHSRLPNDLD